MEVMRSILTQLSETQSHLDQDFDKLISHFNDTAITLTDMDQFTRQTEVLLDKALTVILIFKLKK
jgi:uncharacterized membrane-anchored protein YhcB (DUF1043 family)